MLKTRTGDILVASHHETGDLKVLLTDLGYKTSIMPSGEQTLGYLRTHTPALMILDAHLTDLSGISIAYRCKKLSRLKAVPSIVLVNTHDQKMRAQAERCAADKVLFRPYSARNLKTMVQTLLYAQMDTSQDALPTDPLGL